MIKFSNRRTKCPKCNSNHSVAKILVYGGKDVSNDDYFKCFSCDYLRTPKTEKQLPKLEISNYYIERIKYFPYDINELFNYSLSLKYTDNFTKFLMNKWGAENEFIESYLNRWNIGSDGHSNTVFWYTNSSGSPFYCKAIQYNYSNCKRENGFISAGLQYRNIYVPINKANGKNGLFGLYQIKNNKVVLVESEKSAILGSFQFDDLSFVATGGSKNFKIEYLDLLPKDIELFVMFDVDKAGESGQEKLSKMLKENGIRHGIIDYSEKIRPYGTDIADVILNKREWGFYGE